MEHTHKQERRRRHQRDGGGRGRGHAGWKRRRRVRECSSFAACQLHLSACQVAAGFDIEGGGADASFRSHFVKGFDSSAASRAQADAAARSRQRVGEREGCGRRRGCNLQVQLRGGKEGEPSWLRLGAAVAGRIAEMQRRQKGEERKEDEERGDSAVHLSQQPIVYF